MRRIAALALSAGLFAGCEAAPQEYQPTRFDYWSFRARVGSLPEPNYLPWTMHVELLPDGTQGLVACRFADSAFPLRYFVVPPEIPAALASDGENGRGPADYVSAVDEAFAAWQKAIGRPVRFERVERREHASVAIQLVAETQAVEEGAVLGVVRGERERCRVTGAGSTLDRVEIEFAPSEATLYIADSVGLLTQRQVRAVALHEIGHLLGVSGRHSPLAGDVMYAVAGDRRIEALSDHDRGSLRALYAVPPGSVYARLGEAHSEPLAEIRRGPPKLATESHDERNGFRVRFPRDWQVLRTPSGFIAVDGVSWDYDASIQVVAARGSPGAHLSLLAGQGLARGDDVRSEVFELDGEPIARLLTRGVERAEQTDVIAWREGWVVIVIADSRARDFDLYQPWFQRVLLSLEPRDVERAAVDSRAAE
ncbi:MAG: matrixin family metalloprotease [Myxococcota bacterium]